MEKSVPVRLTHITTVPLTLGFVRGQVGYMKERGFEVHALSSPGELLDQFAERERVPVSAIEMTRQITPWRDVGAVFRVWQALRDIRPTIVHAHTPKAGLVGMIGASLARCPIRIYHIRGLPFMTATGLKGQILRWTERTSCRLAHQVLCVSPSVREVAVAEGICPAEKIRVLRSGSGNGVDAAGRFNPAQVGEGARQATRAAHAIPADAPVVGFVGRVVRDKGLIELAEAWKRLREEFPALHMLIVGPFEPQDPVPPDVEALLRNDSRIHLTGHVGDLPPFYAAMDVLAFPTYREGFGNAAIEAASLEIPVVATRIPGCVDSVQDGVTGTLVPPRDAAALTEALRMYLADPALRRRHGSAGRERVLREFQQEAVWEAMYQEYLRLLRENPRTAAFPTATGREFTEAESGVLPAQARDAVLSGGTPRSR